VTGAFSHSIQLTASKYVASRRFSGSALLTAIRPPAETFLKTELVVASGVIVESVSFVLSVEGADRERSEPSVIDGNVRISNSVSVDANEAQSDSAVTGIALGIGGFRLLAVLVVIAVFLFRYMRKEKVELGVDMMEADVEFTLETANKGDFVNPHSASGANSDGEEDLFEHDLQKKAV
jgi:hypothetical protein